MQKFINFTNHLSSKWGEKQIQCARIYGEIKDIPFPNISPYITDEEFCLLAEKYINILISEKPCCVLCQGESVFATLIVSMLLKNNIPVVAAVSERRVKERIDDGQTIKTVVFEFVKFRKYVIIN